MRMALFSVVVTMMVALVEQDAFARAGGGRSFGSRGSRSYSRPMSPPSQMPSRQYAPSQPYQGPAQGPYQQPRRGFGFGTGLLGGLAGGLLGGMLFRSLGFGGGFGAGGGIGLFDILLLAGIGYLLFRFIKKRSGGDRPAGGSVLQMGDYQRQPYEQTSFDAQQGPGDVDAGLSHIRQMDPSFDERRFGDDVMDLFFRIQGAWMNRDLSGVRSLLTDEMRGILQQDVDRLVSEHQVNRLENIAVRKVEVSEAWQEGGQDFVTALIYANLLDYTTDDRTGAVISGSKSEPVKFEEYWTFTRPVGNNPWRLSAISQK
ncbi:Tim44 domain-containing protein [Geomonas sp. RF6]|uniref:Tim44 domain-containing protein n=1 Tax=Geomonas sp. RF6 TaxID=2897342 RepID=UPI003FA5CB84